MRLQTQNARAYVRVALGGTTAVLEPQHSLHHAIVDPSYV
jgi:hypothetical protein